MIKTLVVVAAGGAVGAVARYMVMVGAGQWLGFGFPYGTLIVNVVGSFILGALIETGALLWTLGPDTRAFLVVGMLGAFTTFSTFSMDAIVLYERHAYGAAALYVTASVVMSIGAFFMAMRFIRIIAG